MEINVDELKKNLKKFKILDVRESDEFFEHIKGAENKPLGALIRDINKGVYNLPKDKEIICYCSAGFRGNIAADFLRSKEYKVKNLEGGFKAWKEGK